MITSSNSRSMRASLVSMMLPLWRFSRRVSQQGSSPTATVWKPFLQCSLPGKKNPGSSIVTTLSCSSILRAHSPSNANSSISPSLVCLVRAARAHWHLSLLPPLAPVSTSTTAPVKSESTDAKLGWTRCGKCYHCSREGHWA
jgi:hypothetical protein